MSDRSRSVRGFQHELQNMSIGSASKKSAPVVRATALSSASDNFAPDARTQRIQRLNLFGRLLNVMWLLLKLKCYPRTGSLDGREKMLTRCAAACR